MRDQRIVDFELSVNRILDWSSIDAGTKDVLHNLMAEVAALAEKMDPNAKNEHGVHWSGHI